MDTNNSRRFPHRHGVTLIELLVSLTILSLVMIGTAGLLNSSWQSFSDLKWQNRVDTEARRALDSMTDSLRTAGWQADLYDSPPQRGSSDESILDGGSANNAVVFNNPVYISLNTSRTRQNTPYLSLYDFYAVGNKNQVAAYYIKQDNDPQNDGVQFRYEYRTVTGPNDANTDWNFNTTDDPSINNGTPYYTTKTIYFTVTAEFNPYPNSIDSRTYTRTLTGAVTLRAPFNEPIAPSAP